MEAATEHDPHAVDAREAKRLETLRKQMREQDQNRYRDPDAKDERRGIYVVYVWRRGRLSSIQYEKLNDRRNLKKNGRMGRPLFCMSCGASVANLPGHKCVRKPQWWLLAFKRDRPTPARLRRWRRKLKVGDDEMLRVVDLITAQRFGAGAAPQLPPQSKRTTRLERLNQKLRAKEEQRAARRLKKLKVKQVRTRTPPGLTCCDYVGPQGRCRVRAPWYVAYTSPRAWSRVLKRRCTKHAWYDKYLPVGARHIVRVKRTVKKRKVRR
jgi:hypothetical protein